MVEPRAIMVDDDPQQLLEASEAIREAGFELQTFPDAGSMLDFLDGEKEFIDLFVLDRKLPMRSGESKADEIGDALFKKVKNEYRDSRILVFSGHTDFDHAQALMEGGGLVFQHGTTQIGRVTVLRKTQFDLFERHLAELRSVIHKFEHIDVVAAQSLEAVDRRVLRRIGYHYGATAVRANLLGGGLTPAKVWACEVTTPDGAVAHVVAKQGKSAPGAGGLQDLLPREHIARRVEAIAGLMGSYVVSILQTAGADPIPLMDLIGTDDETAAELTVRLTVNLDTLERSAQTSRTLRDIVAPIVTWEELVERLETFSVPIPPADIWVTTTSVMSHADLHPGNVLVCEGQPVIIDSDGNAFASSLVDPITLMMSSFAHPHSAIAQGDWPTSEWVGSHFGDEAFGTNSPCPRWYAVVHSWVLARQSSPREFWAIALAFAVRQLQFSDVLANAAVRGRVLATAEKASRHLVDT